MATRTETTRPATTKRGKLLRRSKTPRLPTLEEIEEEERRRADAHARTGLLPFTERTFLEWPGGEYDANWHHAAICGYLDRILTGDLTRLILCVGPRRGKSELASRRLPAMALGRDPDEQIIACSYGADLATDMSRDVKSVVGSERFASLYPDTRLNPKRTDTDESRGAKNTADQWEIVGHTGRYLARGVGGGITGKGFTLGIIDDPVKDDEAARSPTIRDRIWRWYQKVFRTRAAPGARIVIMMTRWHEDDLVGRLLEEARTNPDAEQWTVVNFREIREDEPNPDDTRAVGEVLWPARFGLAEAEARKRADPATHAALYQQRPSALEGNILQVTWLQQRYRYGTVDPQTPGEWRIYGDLKNGSKQPKSSFAVFQVWFRPSSQPARRYLIEQVRGRWDQLEEEHALRNLVARFPQVGKKGLEDKADSRGVIVHLADEIDGLVEVRAIAGSKADRLRACSHLFSASNVWLPEGAPWLAEYVHELTAFPGAANDDQVDTTSLALNDWTEANKGFDVGFWYGV